jgi:sigma-E factor negative regulatory protein RseA
MSQESEGKLPALGDLSSLMDGELDASAAGKACGLWRDDPEARARWHTYQLIGDVLRSDDLASGGAHDAAFLAAFRQRLASEPVVLAPAAAPAPQVQVMARRRAWATPMAVAAGFAAVAGVLVVTQVSGSLSWRSAQPDTSLAQTSNGLMTAAVMAGGTASGVVGDPPVVVLNGQLIRDARLDEYLAAHKKFGGSSVPGGPSGFLRNAAADGTTH